MRFLVRLPKLVSSQTAAVGLTLLALLGASLTSPPVQAAAQGFHVKNGRLLDGNGQSFVIRGVNHPHTWFPSRTSKALKDIKATGANTARIVLSSGVKYSRNTASDVASVINRCKASKLVCVLEVHDTTGYGEQSGTSSLSAAVNYWRSIKQALVGQERYVILNIGNEPRGNTNAGAWTGETKSAIAGMRAAGLNHTLMVDGPNWGQDWQFVMRDNAKQVFNADPKRNVVFSIHMYEVFGTAAKVNDYLNRFASAKLPIVVGEFGHWHGNSSVDEDAIFAAGKRLGVGLLAWSWSGNGGGLGYLDLVSGFDAGKPTWWGKRTISGVNGIKATSRQASVFK